ncbi:MAG: hypothetical protein GX879_04380, partial [Bacteroidales bacterium]|nr:hypothetical protein [Bacteroidales bacterium]
MELNREKIHEIIYFIGLVLIAGAMSFSIFVTSLAHFLLITNYLLEGKYLTKLKTLWERKSVLVFLILILVHFLWLFNTSDFAYAMNDIRIKLPLLALPVIIGSSKALSFKKIKVILWAFVTAIFVNTIWVSVIMQTVTETTITDDFREASVFISHIRLSLMIVLSIFILLWFLINKKIESKIELVLSSLGVAWFIFFLILSQFFTGIVLLFVVGAIFVLWRVLKVNNLKIKISAIGFSIIAVFAMAFMAYGQVKEFYKQPVRSFNQLLEETENGNTYYHDKNSRVLENGNYVYVEICETELRQAWEMRSRLSIDSLDSQNQPVLHTLIRFLTSKGLPKDANAVMSLSNIEVMAIEDGVANERFVDGISFFDRIYQFIWQIDVYLKGGNPSGHSLTQRIEFFKVGVYILKSNLAFGVGTGDVQLAYNQAYEEINSQLEPEFRHRAHNQILTFYIAFGIIGATLCLIAIFFPVIIEPKNTKYFISVFLIIAIVSMFNEDTIETATGSAFFAYFYSLFLWGFQN